MCGELNETSQGIWSVAGGFGMPNTSRVLGLDGLLKANTNIEI